MNLYGTIINKKAKNLKESKEGWIYGGIWREEREGRSDMIIVSQRKGKRLVYTKEGGEYQFPDCFWTQGYKANSYQSLQPGDQPPKIILLKKKKKKIYGGSISY